MQVRRALQEVSIEAPARRGEAGGQEVSVSQPKQSLKTYHPPKKGSILTKAFRQTSQRSYYVSNDCDDEEPISRKRVKVEARPEPAKEHQVSTAASANTGSIGTVADGNAAVPLTVAQKEKRKAEIMRQLREKEIERQEIQLQRELAELED